MELEQQTTTENAIVETSEHSGTKVGICLGAVALAITGFFLVRKIVRKQKAKKELEEVAE